jgi:hypothetical protein
MKIEAAQRLMAAGKPADVTKAIKYIASHAGIKVANPTRNDKFVIEFLISVTDFKTAMKKLTDKYGASTQPDSRPNVSKFSLGNGRAIVLNYMRGGDVGLEYYISLVDSNH